MEKLIIEFDEEGLYESFESQLWDSGLVEQLQLAMEKETGYELLFQLDRTKQVMEIKRLWKKK